jgi:hypothetical protein
MSATKILSVTLFMMLATSTVASGFWFGKTMSLKEAEKRWGKKEFSAAEFKTASVDDRAKMAASLISKKKDLYVGKPIHIIRNELGGHDGYYFTDWIPAYVILMGRKLGEETWQVVFLPDEKDLIKDIIIHKNGS